MTERGNQRTLIVVTFYIDTLAVYNYIYQKTSCDDKKQALFLWHDSVKRQILHWTLA